MTLTEQIVEAARFSNPGEIVTIDFDPNSDWVAHYNVAKVKLRGEHESNIVMKNNQTENVIMIINRYSDILDPGISIIDTVEVDDIQDLDTERDIELDWNGDEEEED